MADDWQPTVRQPRPVEADARPSPDRDPIALGAHLLTSRRGYRHHGIYAGNGRVVHYAGLSSAWRRGPVEEVPLARFAAGRPVWIKTSTQARYSGAAVVARARSRLGEDRYRITTNNCEHFCAWCIDGAPRSEQIESLFGGPLETLLRRLLGIVRRRRGHAKDRSADAVVA